MKLTVADLQGRDYEPVLFQADGFYVFKEVVITLYVEIGGYVEFMPEDGPKRRVKVPDFGYIICATRGVFQKGTTAEGIHGVLPRKR